MGKKGNETTPEQREGGETLEWVQRKCAGAYLLTGPQVAQLLGVTKQTFRNWVWQKRFPLQPVEEFGGARPRWRADDVAALLDKRRANPPRRGRPKKGPPNQNNNGEV